MTGGAGFIGSAVVRFLITECGETVVNLDKLTYAGNLDSLGAVRDSPLHIFERADIADPNAVAEIFSRHKPDAVMHLAAESHVDRSIDGPEEFIRTNVQGTFTLLQEARRYLDRSAPESRTSFRFLHVSTDEVFGSLGKDSLFSESSPYRPNSPYAASKAASDHLVRSWYHTFGLPVLVTNCSNNYGPFQFPEKLIPLMILNALEWKELPVYGRGENVRDWIFVDDHVQGLYLALREGSPGETYNIGGGNERSNIDVARAICERLDVLSPSESGRSRVDLIKFVKDRPGHDFRYAIDATKIRRDLGWAPRYNFDSGLNRTIDWYLSNLDWCRRVQSGTYRRERLGLGVPRPTA